MKNLNAPNITTQILKEADDYIIEMLNTFSQEEMREAELAFIDFMNAQGWRNGLAIFILTSLIGQAVTDRRDGIEDEFEAYRYGSNVRLAGVTTLLTRFLENTYFEQDDCPESYKRLATLRMQPGLATARKN